MKGPKAIPSARQIARLIGKIENLREGHLKLTVTALMWVRFDPRLAETLIRHIGSYWKNINPVELNNHIVKLPWASALGPILEFSKTQVAKPQRVGFDGWSRCALAGVAKSTGEIYWVGYHRIGGKSQLREAEQSLEPFTKWGFLARDMLAKKSKESSISMMKKPERKRVLDTLISANQKVTVDSYLAALGFSVTRRLAQLDLENCQLLTAKGFTRNRYYVARVNDTA